MPEIIILAGPNGAGKTSFTNQFLREEEGIAFVNADEIARSLAGRGRPRRELDIHAARLMLPDRRARLWSPQLHVRNDALLARLRAQDSVMARAGYHVGLVYLRLPSVDASLACVARRVAEGGHSIPEDTIRRRFHRSLVWLAHYKSLVNEWYVCDSLEGEFPIVEAWSD